MVSIISIGAGSVGDSARPALPTTMSTSGNRQRIMSHALRSSPASVAEARGAVTGMFITIPSSSGGMNSRPSGVIVRSATRATRMRPAHAEPSPIHVRWARPAATSASTSVARNSVRLPIGASPTTNVAPSSQTRGAGRSSSDDRIGR